MLLAVNANPSVDRIWYIPGFEAGRAFRVERTWLGAGGKGCNVARVAADLGAQVAATGFIAGAAGSFVEADLSRHGVVTAFYRLAAGETRTCPTIVDPSSGRITEIREPGPVLAEADAEAFEVHFRALLAQGIPDSPRSPDPGWPLPSVVTLSGSLPPGLAAGFYARLIGAGAEARVPCILDTSGEALRRGWAAAPWAVKVNQEELLAAADPAGEAGVGGVDGRLVDQLRNLVRAGVTLAAVTLGREGLLACDGHKLWRASMPADLEVIQPVGSGDAATAALAVVLDHWLARGSLSAARWPGLGLGDLTEADRAELIHQAVVAMVAAGAANAITEGIATCPMELFATLRDRVRVEAEPLP